MMEHFLTPEIFRAGLNNYLTNRYIRREGRRVGFMCEYFSTGNIPLVKLRIYGMDCNLLSIRLTRTFWESELWRRLWKIGILPPVFRLYQLVGMRME